MIKKGLVWFVVAFVVYSVIATPNTAADAVRAAGNGAQDTIRAVLEFFQALSPGSDADADAAALAHAAA